MDIVGDNEDKIEIPTICISVPLKGETNKYVNFAKLAEEKYGALAFNPRLYRERMRLAADMSGDEMAVDGSESESNMEDRALSGMDGDSTADTKPKKRAKRKLQDSYDSHDPFIDDSEMMFEEQAAATKDGFFVYSGPLIPQGERVQVERHGNLSLECHSVPMLTYGSLGLMGQQSVVVVAVVVEEVVEEEQQEEQLNPLLHGRGKHQLRRRRK